MAYIGQGIKQGTFKVLDTSGNTYNGSNTTFNLGTQVGSAAQLLVSHDGVIQKAGTDYTLATGGTQITFSTAPASGASIFITEISGAVGGTVTPSDTSVTADKLNTALLTGHTDIGANLADADLFLVDDGAGGTLRKVAASRIKTYAGGAALDDITTGDAAVTLATSSGNITIDAQGSDTDIIFKGTDGSSDTTFLTLDGSDGGAATLNNGLTLSDGNLVVASGHGIDFSATSDGANTATNIAELFDDYEEGTFTPPVAPSGGSFSAVGTVLGFYTKIGRMVHVQCSITITNVGSGSSHIDISGLPFTSASTGPVHTMMTSARETQVLGQNDEIIMTRDDTTMRILGAHFGNGMEYSVNFIYRSAT
jgi:hypothetical protein